MTNISNYAFYKCNSIKSISLPSSLKSIAYGAFMSCNSVTEIISLAKYAPVLGSYSVLTVFGGIDTNIPLYVPIGSKSDYAAATGWKELRHILSGVLCGDSYVWGFD